MRNEQLIRERARDGAAAVRAGTPDFRANGTDDEGKRTDVSDALANIMHYCAENGIDFYHAGASADMNFAEESGEK